MGAFRRRRELRVRNPTVDEAPGNGSSAGVSQPAAEPTPTTVPGPRTYSTRAVRDFMAIGSFAFVNTVTRMHPDSNLFGPYYFGWPLPHSLRLLSAYSCHHLSAALGDPGSVSLVRG
jgi:hypothetical protein